jgi:hypothetical protein
MIAAQKVGSKLPRHAVHRRSNMLNRFNVMNRFFVLTSCFHAEPSNLHVPQMPGFLRMLALACIVVQPYGRIGPSALEELGLQYFPVVR